MRDQQFLRTVLELIRQYGEQPEQIYPLWAPQTERFDETLLQAIPIRDICTILWQSLSYSW